MGEKWTRLIHRESFYGSTRFEQFHRALLSLRTRRAAHRRGVRYSFLFMRASGEQLDEITKLIDAGVLRPIIERAYSFDEAPQALAHVEGGRTKGKVVVAVS